MHTATPPIAATPTGRPGENIAYDLFLDCVHCGLCTAHCPTYLETGNENDSPRGRIYLMRAVTDQRVELSTQVRRHLELCLDCRACESACPSGVQYGRLIEPFRIAMEKQPDATAHAPAAKTSDWFHRWVLYGIFPHPRRARLALAPARLLQRLGLDRLIERSGLLKLLPRRLQQLHAMLPPPRRREPPLPEFLPAQGKRRAGVALFTGCVSDLLFRHTNWATARVLQANGCDVHVPRGQVCCGAIHYHSGAEAPALTLARQNCEKFARGDYDAVVVNVAGCGSMLKDYGHAAATAAGALEVGVAERFSAKVQDVSEFLVQLGPIPPRGEVPLKATYHDACHLAHAQQIRQPPRELLQMIPGLSLLPLEESEVCCGAAGTYNLTEPEMSARLSARKMEKIRATGAEAVLTANAGCLLQIEKQARQEGLRLWTAHPIEVLDLSYRGLRPEGAGSR